MSAPRTLLMFNPRASRVHALLEPARELLEAEAGPVELRELEAPRDVADGPRSVAPSVTRVVVGGGDGTLHHAVAPLIESGRSLGILPLGTGNDLARSLGIPLDAEGAVRVILDGELRYIDLARVGGRYFLNVASFGITGTVTRELNAESKRRLGVLSYPVTALSAYRRSRPFRVRLLLDGRRYRYRALQVAVANGRSYGGGMSIDAAAAIDDGWLRVCVIEPQSLWRLAALLPYLKLGRARGRDGVRIERAREIEIRTSRPLSVSADGEIVASTPTRVSVLPRALPVFAPKQG